MVSVYRVSLHADSIARASVQNKMAIRKIDRLYLILLSRFFIDI